VIVGLGHVDLVCRDVGRSLSFYAAVFGELGLQPPHEERGERGETIYYLRFPQNGSGSIGFRQAQNEQEFELYAPGFHHLALAVERKVDVDLSYENARAAGAEILYEPRLWPVYHPDYYATFFLDPNGFRIEVAASRDARLGAPSI
jgi:catechol 2,3-dioxygenase-like lactoylglutathione lyase family enzyme